MSAPEPVTAGNQGRLIIRYCVVAYDESGYGDNRSRNFNDRDDAIAYAEELEPRFGASVTMIIELYPIRIPIWSVKQS